MSDIDERLRQQLDELTGPVPPPDWDAVIAQTGGGRPRTSPRLVALLALTIAISALLVATPLGAAIANGVGGFSTWLTGAPGTPASKSTQQAFAKANGRSWIRFPAGTGLRQLTTVTAAGSSIDLLGYRDGDSLCLGILVTGTVSGTSQVCAPLATLRDASSPVQVALIDQGFGRGTKTAWYGLNRFTAPALQVTAGIAADGTRSVTVHDQSGTHTVPVHGDAFLYVAAEPDVAQTITEITAHTALGAAAVAVPFAPSIGPGLAGIQPSAGRLTGPTTIQRQVTGGTIGWLTSRQPVGQPLSVLSPRLRALIGPHAVYGRIVTPDPSLPYRIAITLNTSPRGTKPIGVCTWQIGQGAGGGCQRLKGLFASAPITSGLGGGQGSSEYSTLGGLASDQVARITAYLSNGQTVPVALADNAYFADLPRDGFPVRLVAYDSEGLIIGLLSAHTFQGFSSTPAEGRPTLIASTGNPRGRYLALYTGPSTTGVALHTGPSTTGGTCTYIKWRESTNEGGVEYGCSPLARGSKPRRRFLDSMGNPAFMLTGRAPTGTTTVILRYADRTSTRIAPVGGYIVFLIPSAHIRTGHQLTWATAVTAAGKTLASQTFNRAR